ncbi:MULTISPECIES: CcdB family protein [Methylococcus]|uniref:Toxin CcdB n=1 Tax=Methylococcus capsulatus TaxID=414 RepID=A0ABZ2F7V0_METCP|nr:MULTISPECIES: CcdB family protein [Methylococcus]MDF9391007.1 plasmid maintenance protein CcdB [Methylococcus capsulatus]
MAQFDVHRNTGPHRDAVPFVVIVQSSLFDAYRRRVVVPLVRRDRLGAVPDPGFNPAFTLEGVDVVLHPLEIVLVPVARLGGRVGSLSDVGDQIIGAIDQMLSQAWR